MAQLMTDYSLKLTPQLLVLVTVPILVELGLLAAVSNLEREAETEAREAAKATQISRRLQQMHSHMGAIVAENLGERSLRIKSDTEELKRQSEKAFADYQELEKLVADRPDDLKIIEESKASARRALEVLLETRRSYARAPETEVEYRKKLFARLRFFVPSLMSDEMVSLGRKFDDVVDSSPERQARVRRETHALIVAGGIANLVLFAGLALFIVKRITGRLAIMNRNAYLLAEGKPLSEHIGGTDEIAELDRSFHKMADAMNQSNQVKQEILMMVSHDLRTPLCTVQNFLEMCREGALGPLSEKGTNLAGSAEANCLRMINLTNDLLDIDKVKAGAMPVHLEEVELKQIIDAAVNPLIAFAAEQNVKIETESIDATISGDKEKLIRVVTNLLSNAIKFSPPGGTVKVTAGFNGNGIEVKVSDEGEGIPSEMLDTVFDRFCQVHGKKSVEGGSGLGLAICKEFIALHGGEIRVESRQGKGSTFIFVLPLRPDG